MATVKEVLDDIHLILVHVSIRRRTSSGIEYLGGGFSDSVSQRFGSLQVVGSLMQNDVFILFVE